MAFLAGLHYWWPKMFGKMYNEVAARVAFVFVFFGFNITFFSQFILGAKGMPRRYYNYLPEFQTLHVSSTVGSWLLAVGFFIILGYFVRSLLSGEKAPDNPWESSALEWKTASPPTTYNFDKPLGYIKQGPYDYPEAGL